MNMELFEIWESLANISESLRCNQIEFSYDSLMGVMGNSRPSDTLDCYIIPKIDWDTSSPDMSKISEAYHDLVEFNKCFNVKELKDPIKRLKKFLAENK